MRKLKIKYYTGDCFKTSDSISHLERKAQTSKYQCYIVAILCEDLKKIFGCSNM
jgi:hypothetical protein